MYIGTTNSQIVIPPQRDQCKTAPHDCCLSLVLKSKVKLDCRQNMPIMCVFYTILCIIQNLKRSYEVNEG